MPRTTNGDWIPFSREELARLRALSERAAAERRSQPAGGTVGRGSPRPVARSRRPVPWDIREAADIRYGVEIECLIPRDSGIGIGGYHRGRSISDVAPASVDSGWNAQVDMSVRPTRSSDSAGEIVSPILSGADGLYQIQRITRWLQSLGATVNRTCGLHIHIDWPHDSLRVLRNLIHYVSNYEDSLFASTGSAYRKFRPDHAQPIKPAVKSRRFDQSGLMQNSYLLERYQSLNLTRLMHSGRADRTVEFRLFAGTLNPLKIATHVQMVLALVNAAETCTGQPDRDYSPESESGPAQRRAAKWYKFEASRFLKWACWRSRNGKPARGYLADGPYPLRFMAAATWTGTGRDTCWSGIVPA